LVEDFTANEQAESGQPLDLLPLPRMLPSPPRRESRQAAQFPIVHVDLLRRSAVIGHRPHHAGLRPVEQAPGDQTFKPSFSHNGVIIQKDDIPPARLLDPLVTSRREAAISLVADHDYPIVTRSASEGV